jgi:glycosyltransferase involved in cell wall biosynthesis
MAAPGPYISVIICSYNRCEALSELLGCFLNQETAGRFAYELIVVDNNSNDETQKVIGSYAETFKGLLRHYFEPRQGKQHALNLGIKESKGEVLVFTDDDCLVEKNYLAGVYEAFKRHESEIDFMGGKILPRWVGGEQPSLINEFYPVSRIDRIQWSGKDKPGWLDSYFLGPLGILDYGDKPFVIDYAVNKQGGRLFYGANMAFKRGLFDKYGDFHIGRTVTQDMEICLRFLKSGAKGLYAPHVQVFHKIKVGNITPDYYYRWYFKRGLYLKDIEQYTAKFYHPLGIQLSMIAKTAVFFIKSLFINSMIQRMYYRCKGLFNLGRMIEIAKDHIR